MRGRREKQLNSEEAVKYAFESVGPALLITTVVLTAGFSVLMLSTLKLNFELGLITSITITIALIVDFMLLPVILLTFDNADYSQKSESNSQLELIAQT